MHIRVYQLLVATLQVVLALQCTVPQVEENLEASCHQRPTPCISYERSGDPLPPAALIRTHRCSQDEVSREGSEIAASRGSSSNLPNCEFRRTSERNYLPPPFDATPDMPHLAPVTRTCLRHTLVPVPVQVVDECITNVPVVRKTVGHQVETVTRHVPVMERTVTQQEEKYIRQVPVSRKILREVVETRVRHVPVIKSRSRTVVEPYTVHVPITERYTRPIEEAVIKSIPVAETRMRPVVLERTRLVSVLQKRVRPVVVTKIHHIPIRHKILRHLVEQRVRPVVCSCQPCEDGQYSQIPRHLSLGPTGDRYTVPSKGESKGPSGLSQSTGSSCIARQGDNYGPTNIESVNLPQAECIRPEFQRCSPPSPQIC